MRRNFFKLLMVLIFSGTLPLCATAQPVAVPAPVPATEPADANYIIGPGDGVEVRMLDRTDFNSTDKVAADGTIRIPLIGAVAAADRTTLVLAEQIKAALVKGGFFEKPNLNVQVVSYAARYVTVLGAVGSPGLVPIDRAYRLSEILARVGGVREGGADYVVVTPAKGAQRQLSVRSVATGDLSQDPYVSPGDKIYSPPAEVFYVSGQVKAPGAYPMVPGMTVRMAISRGGGVTDMGSDRSVKVTRGDKTIKPGLDSAVQAGDVIKIGERLF